eukprot:2255988-Amphidinium_carterae.2
MSFPVPPPRFFPACFEGEDNNFITSIGLADMWWDHVNANVCYAWCCLQSCAGLLISAIPLARLFCKPAWARQRGPFFPFLLVVLDMVEVLQCPRQRHLLRGRLRRLQVAQRLVWQLFSMATRSVFVVSAAKALRSTWGRALEMNICLAWCQLMFPCPVQESDECSLLPEKRRKGWKFMPWNQFLQKQSKNTEFKLIVSDALKKFEGSEEIDSREAVATCIEHSFVVDRSFVLLSDKDIRRSKNIPRVPKAMVKNLPTVMVPSDDPEKGAELHYVFSDPAEPFKKAKVRYSLAANQKYEELRGKDVLWAGQAPAYLKHAVKVAQTSSGVGELLQRDLSGHLHLVSVSDFLGDEGSEQVGDEADGVEGNGDEDALGVEAVEEGSLIGVAACPAVSPFLKQQGQKKQKSSPASMRSSPDGNAQGQERLQRLSSCMSVVSAHTREPSPRREMAGEMASNVSMFGNDDFGGAKGHAFQCSPWACEAVSLC